MGAGIKHDSDKLRWDLLPYEQMEEVVAVLTFGAKKYGAYNWKELDDMEDRTFAALMRHGVERKKGNIIDPETGRHHLAHLICCALFHMWKDMQDA